MQRASQGVFTESGNNPASPPGKGSAQALQERFQKDFGMVTSSLLRKEAISVGQ